MNFILTEIETRVLGSLIEKDITTPDYYPLSLIALGERGFRRSILRRVWERWLPTAKRRGSLTDACM